MSAEDEKHGDWILDALRDAKERSDALPDDIRSAALRSGTASALHLQSEVEELKHELAKAEAKLKAIQSGDALIRLVAEHERMRNEATEWVRMLVVPSPYDAGTTRVAARAWLQSQGIEVDE